MKVSEILSENFQFLLVIFFFSIYLNRHVFIMSINILGKLEFTKIRMRLPLHSDTAGGRGFFEKPAFYLLKNFHCGHMVLLINPTFEKISRQFIFKKIKYLFYLYQFLSLQIYFSSSKRLFGIK